MQSQGKGEQRIHLCTGNQGDVWTTTITMNCTWCPCPTPGNLWMPYLKQDPGTMDTWHPTHKFHLGCWWFWDKVFWKITWTTPQIITIRQVQNHRILEGKTIHWNITSVLPWKRCGPAIHTRICMCSTPFISERKTKTNTIFTIPMEPNYPWKE